MLNPINFITPPLLFLYVFKFCLEERLARPPAVVENFLSLLISPLHMVPQTRHLQAGAGCSRLQQAGAGWSRPHVSQQTSSGCGCHFLSPVHLSEWTQTAHLLFSVESRAALEQTHLKEGNSLKKHWAWANRVPVPACECECAAGLGACLWQSCGLSLIREGSLIHPAPCCDSFTFCVELMAFSSVLSEKLYVLKCALSHQQRPFWWIMSLSWVHFYLLAKQFEEVLSEKSRMEPRTDLLSCVCAPTVSYCTYHKPVCSWWEAFAHSLIE